MNKQEKIKSLFDELHLEDEYELELTEDRAKLILKNTCNKNKVYKDYSHNSMVKYLYEFRRAYKYWNQGRESRPA